MVVQSSDIRRFDSIYLDVYEIRVAPSCRRDVEFESQDYFPRSLIHEII